MGSQEPPKPVDLILKERRDRVEEVVANRTRSLVVVLEDLEDPHNIAAVLRTCEGMGIQEVHAITRRYSFFPNAKITQGAEKWLDLRLYRSTERCLNQLKERGFLICVTDLGETAKTLFELPRQDRLALVFGTEKIGVSKEARSLCDLRFQIPMQGFTQSYNVSVAAAVCLSHIIFRRLEEQGTTGDLSCEERELLKERFFTLSVKQRNRIYATTSGAPREDSRSPGNSARSAQAFLRGRE